MFDSGMGSLCPMGAWAGRAATGGVPSRVGRIVRRQILNIIGGMVTGAASPGVQAVKRSSRRLAEAETGARILPGGARVAVEDAIVANAAASIALDYDDYLFMGHTGHSTVVTALAVGEAVGASLDEVVTAASLGNEIAGRLGASAFLGPLNGQMWGFVHAPGAAIAAGVLLGLDEAAMCNALALSLTAPPFTLEPAFFGEGGKLLVAGPAAVMGYRAACLAKEGLQGALDVLDDPRGFFHRFSFAPLRVFLGGLGETWLSESLSFKQTPGCAYFQTAVEALDRALTRRGGAHPDDVTSVDVSVGYFSYRVDELGDERIIRTGRLGPVAATFSLRATLAIALLEGGVPRAQAFSHERVVAADGAIRRLADRIAVCHHLPHTLALADRAREVFDGRDAFQGLGMEELFEVIRRLRSEHASAFDTRKVPGLARYLLDVMLSPRIEGGMMVPLDGAELVFPFPASVSISFADGTTSGAEVRHHTGSPFGEAYLGAVEARTRGDLGDALGQDAADELVSLVLGPGDVPITTVLDPLCR